MTAITCWGDSLTYGTGTTDPATMSWPARLSSLLGGQTVNDLGVPGEISADLATRVAADTTHRSDIQIFWTGHNDPSRPGVVAASIASCVAAISPNTNYLVLSTITRTYEPAGSAGNDQVTALNATLASTYGSKFVDILTPLVNAYNPTDTGDLSSFALGLIPDSLRATADTIHLTDGAYALIARQLAQVIFAKGWATTSIVLANVIPAPTRSSDEVLAVYQKDGQDSPFNILLRHAQTTHAGYVSAGYFRGPAAVLDVSVDTAARATL